MTEKRVPNQPTPQPLNPAGRPLLNLNGGDRRGLERAFQTLVGRAKPNPAPFLQVLHELGFTATARPDQPLTFQVVHFMAEREVTVTIETERDPEEWALGWAGRYFPEMEFYLPYISRRSAYAKKLAKAAGPRPLSPEPDYDEDGFLADYS